MATITRKTGETDIRISAIVGSGTATIATGEPFLDHMLVTFAKYSGIDLDVKATGDLRHHLIEDVAIALGAALRAITPANAARFGDRTIPMDEALVHVSIDLGGRFYYAGRVPSSLYDHFLRSLAEHARATVHVRVLRGRDRHHVVEAAVKALGLAVGEALVQQGAIFSTKGAVDLRAD